MGKSEKKSRKSVASETEGVAMDVDSTVDASKGDDEGPSYEDRLKAASAIAHPMSSKKLTRKVLKTVKKAAKAKSVKRGVKEVVKALRKGSKGIVIIAGDISPIDVISHVPILCEEADVPYAYVPSKEDLGQAGSTKRPTSVVMIVPGKDGDFKETYDEIRKEFKELDAGVEEK